MCLYMNVLQQSCKIKNDRFYLFLIRRLKVGVEDAQSDDYIPVTVVVSTGMTIAQLKDKVQLMCFHALFFCCGTGSSGFC